MKCNSSMGLLASLHYLVFRNDVIEQRNNMAPLQKHSMCCPRGHSLYRYTECLNYLQLVLMKLKKKSLYCRHRLDILMKLGAKILLKAKSRTLNQHVDVTTPFPKFD